MWTFHGSLWWNVGGSCEFWAFFKWQSSNHWVFPGSQPTKKRTCHDGIHPSLVAVLFARTLTTLSANATAMMGLLPTEAVFPLKNCRERITELGFEPVKLIVFKRFLALVSDGVNKPQKISKGKIIGSEWLQLFFVGNPLTRQSSKWLFFGTLNLAAKYYNIIPVGGFWQVYPFNKTYMILW